MKIKTIITGLLLILVTSCSESYLDIPSRESLSTAVYFRTQADFEAAVNGIYAPLRGWFNTPANSISPLILIGDVHSDIARYALNPNFRATEAVELPADFVPERTLFSGYWNDFYSWISRSNQVIANIDEISIDEVVKGNLKGQALFFRAYSYWWLLRLYGNAVLQLEPVASYQQTSKALSSEAEIKAQIIKDATDAAGMLYSKTNTNFVRGRVSNATAYMLLADLHMWYKEWALAEAALKNITGYSLIANYANIYDPSNKNNAESIWEIQYSSSSSSYASTICYSMMPTPLTAARITALTGVTNPSARSGSEMYGVPTPELIASYEPGDTRLAASIRNVLNDNGVVFPMCIKYLHTHSTMNQSNDNLPVYRYAETLLYLAEAINEQNRTAEAQGYLNQVRNRAGLANITAATQADLRAAIINERKVEFAFEGKRWWDLVRTGTVNDVIPPYGAR